jgi:hypothetical protein
MAETANLLATFLPVDLVRLVDFFYGKARSVAPSGAKATSKFMLRYIIRNCGNFRDDNYNPNKEQDVYLSRLGVTFWSTAVGRESPARLLTYAKKQEFDLRPYNLKTAPRVTAPERKLELIVKTVVGTETNYLIFNDKNEMLKVRETGSDELLVPQQTRHFAELPLDFDETSVSVDIMFGFSRDIQTGRAHILCLSPRTMYLDRKAIYFTASKLLELKKKSDVSIVHADLPVKCLLKPLTRT